MREEVDGSFVIFNDYVKTQPRVRSYCKRVALRGSNPTGTSAGNIAPREKLWSPLMEPQILTSTAAPNVVINILRVRDDEVGDGTMSARVPMAELLHEAENLVEKKDISTNNESRL